MRAPLRIAAILALSLAALAGRAQGGGDWLQWRGPHFNGSSDETGLPVRFSPTEGVKWSAALPGPSAATPIVCGDSVFVTAADIANKQLLALCFDRTTGAEKWRRAVGSGYMPAGRGNEVQLDERSNYASPSPATDGKRVIFFFGNGDLAAYDFAGKQIWARNLQKDYGDFCFGWTFSSTPLLYDGRLYMQILQRDIPVSGRGRPDSPSYLLALDPATGKELWRAMRPSPARMESREAFTSPVPYEHGGRRQILLSGGDMLSGHDPTDGRELWRWGTWNNGHIRPDYRTVPSPVGGAGVVLGCGPKKEPVFAIRADSNGDVSETGVAWKSEPRSSTVTSDVPTPLFYRGKFYVASDLMKAISCVDPADGRVIWSTPLDVRAACWASPTGADGKIYLLSLRGDAHVLDAASGQLLATNPMAPDETEIRSCIVPARGNLFIRTNSRLYCIGK